MEKNLEVSSSTKTKKKSKREIHIDARYTQEEFDIINERAKECGMCRSKYVRMTSLGHHPRHRLTEEEVAAINTLDSSRRDLRRFTNKVDAMSPQEKARVFGSVEHAIEWRGYADSLMNQWKEIREDVIKD